MRQLFGRSRWNTMQLPGSILEPLQASRCYKAFMLRGILSGEGGGGGGGAYKSLLHVLRLERACAVCVPCSLPCGDALAIQHPCATLSFLYGCFLSTVCTVFTVPPLPA